MAGKDAQVEPVEFHKTTKHMIWPLDEIVQMGRHGGEFQDPVESFQSKRGTGSHNVKLPVMCVEKAKLWLPQDTDCASLSRQSLGMGQGHAFIRKKKDCQRATRINGCGYNVFSFSSDCAWMWLFCIHFYPQFWTMVFDACTPLSCTLAVVLCTDEAISNSGPDVFVQSFEKCI